MSSDNLDSGCSTCDSEKSDTDLAATNRLLGLINVDNSPQSPPQIQKNCFGSSTSGESRSSSQESFAKILNFNHNSVGVAGSAPTVEPKSPGAVSSNGGTPNSRRRSKIATGAEKIRFRFPAVKFFSNKKKSWPNLNSSTASSTNGVVLNDFNGDIINNSIETTANIGESNPVNGFGLFRIKNMTRYSSLEHSDPEIRADESNSADPLTCDRRRKACRLPSKEDPGPQREILGVFCDPTAVFGASATTPSPATTASKSISCPAISNPSNGTKLKFVREGQIQICKLNHPRTVLGKLTSSKLLRRWENHFLVLDDDEISSKTSSGFMENPIRYANMEDVHALPQWDCSGDKYCVRIFVPEGSILLQTNHVYSRNQWLFSIQWRRNLYRYRRMIEVCCGRPEVLLKETKCMVEQVKCSPLQGDNLNLKSIVLISRLFEQIYNGNLPKSMLDPIITCAASLLDTVAAVNEISPWLSKYCNDSPRSRLIDEILSDVAQQTLKKTMDFGKYPSARIFVQDYLVALSSQNNGLQRVRSFVHGVHGPASSCPHPRVLPNLVSVCLAGVHSLYDSSASSTDANKKLTSLVIASDRKGEKLECFSAVFETISEFEDWRLPLATLLQPVPFPEEVLSNETFARCFGRVLRRMGMDQRCEIHLSVLGVREGKEGWFHLVCPGGPACSDDGELYSQMLKTLLHCCCRRKKFLQNLNGMLGPIQLLALRENEPCMEALCHMLEFEVVEGEDLKLQMITALQSTYSGRKHYAALCDRQIALKELQQKGGPRKLTLPSKSTDADLAVLLSSGSFGNLEWLSLAFTNVTSACADYLIKLPSLKYLNLWSTQFGDTGLQLLSEHLFKLQVLNLCETPVTDKGLMALAALKNLRKLNLNSTQLSSKTFQTLKAELPALQEVDVRYTDAWCADDFLT